MIIICISMHYHFSKLCPPQCNENHDKINHPINNSYNLNRLFKSKQANRLLRCHASNSNTKLCILYTVAAPGLNDKMIATPYLKLKKRKNYNFILNI